MLAAAMMISMTACGSTAKDTQGAAGETVAAVDGEATDLETAETGADGETATAEVDGDTTESPETDTEVLGGEDSDSEITASNDNTDIKVTVKDQTDEKKNDDGDVLITINVQKLELDGDGYEKLQKVLEQQGTDAYELALESWGDMQAFLEDDDITTAGLPYGIEDTISMKRADDTVFSFVSADYSNLGGAHPNTFYSGYNYDSATGKRLTLRDVAADYDGLYTQVLDALKNYEADQEEFEFFDGYEDTVKGMFYGFAEENDMTEDADAENIDAASADADSVETAAATDVSETADADSNAAAADNMQWYLTDDALVLIFNRYDIAAYVYGPTAVKIPFGTGLIKDVYCR